MFCTFHKRCQKHLRIQKTKKISLPIKQKLYPNYQENNFFHRELRKGDFKFKKKIRKIRLNFHNFCSDFFWRETSLTIFPFKLQPTR